MVPDSAPLGKLLIGAFKHPQSSKKNHRGAERGTVGRTARYGMLPKAGPQRPVRGNVLTETQWWSATGEIRSMAVILKDSRGK